MKTNSLYTKIGIIGGGQLGKMMILEAKKLGFYVTILDPSQMCPAHSICDEHIVADFNDETAINELAEKSDIITYEFEHIGYKILMNLEKNGKKIYPTAKSLKIIQNKYTQKQKLKEAFIPVPEFIKIYTEEDLKDAGEEFGYPFILKACTGGYDGKGNALIKSPDEIESCYKLLGNGTIPLMAEKYIPFLMEISVLACRGIKGEIAVYPVGCNIHRESILHKTIVPANIGEAVTKKAMDTAYRVMEIFKGIGMFCVEMFITKNEDVLINEVAPRPHNSGHYTIEGCITSQFENHIRAITGLPLGNTSLIRPTVMINLLGDKSYCGKPFYKGINDALKIEGVKVHIYGKEKTMPKRKMGHITVTGDVIEKALVNADKAFKKLKVISKEINNV